MLARTYRWFDRTILELGREFRFSYLPPLMVYVAYGVSGLTAIVGTFFVKDYLGLSAEFLAALGFWAGIPWALKMPLGHLVDLIWRHKAGLVYLGACLLFGRKQTFPAKIGKLPLAAQRPPRRMASAAPSPGIARSQTVPGSRLGRLGCCHSIAR